MGFRAAWFQSQSTFRFVIPPTHAGLKPKVSRTNTEEVISGVENLEEVCRFEITCCTGTQVTCGAGSMHFKRDRTEHWEFIGPAKNGRKSALSIAHVL